MKAIWNDTVIAESDETLSVENNYYFPESSVNKKFLENSETHTTCPWKGVASYYNIVINDAQNKDAAWYYQTPKPMAKEIKNYIAFWKGVKIIK